LAIDVCDRFRWQAIQRIAQVMPDCCFLLLGWGNLRVGFIEAGGSSMWIFVVVTAVSLPGLAWVLFESFSSYKA
jgi:hypothetical protein